MHIPPNWGTFFALIVSFLVFWLIFSRLFFRPFLNLIAARERRFKDLNDRTEQLVKDARAAESAREKRLTETRAELIARRESERRSAEAAAAELMEAARGEARGTLERVRAGVEEDLKNAERELDRIGHTLAAELAEKVLGRRIDPNPNGSRGAAN
jgi:F0F1-type ATP synthase membrane subunit b/b'